MQRTCINYLESFDLLLMSLTGRVQSFSSMSKIFVVDDLVVRVRETEIGAEPPNFFKKKIYFFTFKKLKLF
jgi:hypothetical protein